VDSAVLRLGRRCTRASKQPKLTWTGWRHIAVALAIGSDHARQASGGRTDTPLYIRVMNEFLRKTGFAFLNKDDRTCAVRLLPIGTRSTLPPPPPTSALCAVNFGQ
jgi:hypothetical protein